MNIWIGLFLFLSVTLSIGSFLPLLRFTSWTVRVFDFIRIQLLVVLFLLFVWGMFLYDSSFTPIWVILLILLTAIVHHCIIIFPYLSTFRRREKPQIKPHSVSLICVNVLQTNTDYQRLIAMIEEYSPDILLTTETNSEWERALSKIEHQYQHIQRIPRENTYGMHFYTKLEVQKIQEHFFISEENPAIEAHLKDSRNNDVVFWGVHPPPPSPTEKATSKQKDAELMTIAKRIAKSQTPTLVAGDFNSVCWSRNSKLFAKISKVRDARLGKGILGTFPVRPKLFRFPIDLLFYSEGVEINEIRTLPDIGSDHLPLFTRFTIISPSRASNNNIGVELKETADNIIQEGHDEVREEE